MASSGSVIDWLLDSDPAIRWQVMHDLLDAPAAEWQAERARVETEGWGAKLLSHQDADGQWAGGAFLPAGYTEETWRELGQAWTATCFSLQQLCEFGLDPASRRARETVRLIGQHSRWDHDGQPFWDGEVEECINARTVTADVYFGVDVSTILARLLGERQADGGWNCERCNGSDRSSFHTTINVLEALLAYGRAKGTTPEIAAAGRAGEEYLLERRLLRGLTSGAVVDERYLAFLYPYRWRYDVLRGLDYFRAAGGVPDPRLAEAVAHLRSKRMADGRWRLDWSLKGPVWFEMETVGEPSRWITLRALRVLRWWNENAGR